MNPIAESIFLGYRVKRPWDPGPGWEPIERICCVGSHSEPPDGWIERWDFNRAFCYATPEAAWATVVGDRLAYRLFAYYLFPLKLHESESPVRVPPEEVFSVHLPDLPSPPSEPINMDKLGYDIAECHVGELGYPYSPLVDSGFAGEFEVNRYGLIDDLATALRACGVINRAMPEHAPHWVIWVFGQDVDGPLSREPVT